MRLRHALRHALVPLVTLSGFILGTLLAGTAVVETLFAPRGIIAAELAKGAKVQITGFGNFEVRARGARKGRDPRTGREITIGARTAAVFRAGRGLSAALGRKTKA